MQIHKIYSGTIKAKKIFDEWYSNIKKLIKLKLNSKAKKLMLSL